MEDTQIISFDDFKKAYEEEDKVHSELGKRLLSAAFIRYNRLEEPRIKDRKYFEAREKISDLLERAYKELEKAWVSNLRDNANLRARKAAKRLLFEVDKTIDLKEVEKLEFEERSDKINEENIQEKAYERFKILFD